MNETRFPLAHVRITFIWLMLCAAILTFNNSVSAQEFAQPSSGRLEPGDGVDTIKGIRRFNCLAPGIVATRGAYEDTKFELRHIKSALEMQQQLRVSASVRLNVGMHSADIKSSYLRSDSYTEESVHFMVRVRVTSAERRLSQFPLAGFFHDIPDERFRKHCGDAVVTSVVEGGEFMAILSHQAKSKSAAEQVALTIAVGAWGQDLKADAEKAFSTLTKQSSFTVEVVRKGPAGASLPNLDIPTLTKYALDFPATLKASAGYYPIAFHATPYLRVDQNRLQDIAQKVDRLVTNMDTAWNRRTRIEKSITSKDEYAFPLTDNSTKHDDLKYLETGMTTLADYYEETKKSAIGCLDVGADCKLSLVKPVPSIRAPRLLTDRDEKGFSGGCSKWSNDEKTCYECAVTAPHDGIDKGGSSGRAKCLAMDKTTSVFVRARVAHLNSPTRPDPHLLQAGVKLMTSTATCGDKQCSREGNNKTTYDWDLDLNTKTDSTGAIDAWVESFHCLDGANNDCKLNYNSITFTFTKK